MTIEQRQQEIIDEFAVFDDWLDKYQYIVDLGNNLEELPEEFVTDQNLIDGCQSKVWLAADFHDGTVFFRAKSDAIVVKGIVSLLISVLSGHTPDEILNADLHFINKIGLAEHLSPTRSNGLAAMVKQIRLYALAYKSKFQ
ncbi:MAG: SufE family protein [Prevotellaceae bacterium]|jgi:cysteine desulfuration protein SufE|nr:SufE family protein [Prevotellaceae bacterium]